MFRTILQACRRDNLINEDDLVLAGVSGGADSVCLLLLLKELQKEMHFSLYAVHVEHGIRGAESKADAMFVEELCKELKVPLQIFDVKALEYAKEQRLGIEEAARILRYDCYKKAACVLQRKVAEDVSAMDRPVKLALAHHGDDNAETVLFQMIRGSGIDGLAGMQTRRRLDKQIEVIRPLLSVTRAQIEAYLEERGQGYCVDSTNADLAYSRNKIRKQILPLLCEVNSQAISHINQSAAYLQELGEYLQMQVQAAEEQIVCEGADGYVINQQAYKRYPSIIQSEVLHHTLVKAAGAAKDISANHVQVLAGLFDLQVGRRVSLPYGVCAKRVYEGVMLCRNGTAEVIEEVNASEECFFSMEKEELTRLLEQGSYTVAWKDVKIVFRLLDVVGDSGEISKKTYTKCFDYDKMKNSFQIRTRREGDYLVIDEQLHKKRLKEYFINEKIPGELRDEVLLLTEDSKVIWVMGGRISADVKISNQTTKLLKVQITGGNYHEG